MTELKPALYVRVLIAQKSVLTLILPNIKMHKPGFRKMNWMMMTSA